MTRLNEHFNWRWYHAPLIPVVAIAFFIAWPIVLTIEALQGELNVLHP